MDRVGLIQQAIEYEREGYDYYKRQAKRLHDQEVTDLFEMVAEEEMRHIEWLKLMIDEEFTGSEKVALLVAGQPLRSAQINWEAIKRIGLSDINNVYDHAIEMETSAIEFYESLRPVVSGDAERLLDTIIKWEHSHLELFKKLKSSGISTS